MVRTDLVGAVVTVAAQVAENVVRLDLGAGEVLAGVQQMLDLGASDEELAATSVVARDEAAALAPSSG